jgi:hypothetical protein
MRSLRNQNSVANLQAKEKSLKENIVQKFSEAALGGPELSKTKFSESIFSPNFTRSSRNGGGGLLHRPGAGQKQNQNVRRQKIMSLDGAGIIT